MHHRADPVRHGHRSQMPSGPGRSVTWRTVKGTIGDLWDRTCRALELEQTDLENLRDSSFDQIVDSEECFIGECDRNWESSGGC